MNRLWGIILVGMVSIGAIGCAGDGGSSQPGRPRGIDKYIAGVEAHRAGDSPRAIAVLNDAVAQNPDLTMAHLLLGDLYRASQDYESALLQYLATARLDPYYYSNFYRLGLTYQLLARLPEAITSYQRALALKPDDVNSNMNLGLVHLARGENELAVEFTKKASEAAPDSAVAWANLGVALDAAGSLGEAEQAYRKSLDLDPNQAATLLNLGTNLVAQKKATEAISTLDAALRLSDTPLSHRRMGDAYALAKRWDDALKEYRAALALAPNYYPAWNEIGRVWIMQYTDGLELDDTLRARALEAWKKSLSIHVNQPTVKSWIERWSGDPMFGVSPGTKSGQ